MGFLASKASRMPLPYIMIAVFLFFGVYLIALAMRSRVIIDGNRLEIRGAFADYYADVSEIEGYRTISSRNGNYTKFNLRGGRRPITLSLHFEKDESFDQWIGKIPDLDKRDRDRILEKISQQEDLGSSPQERLRPHSPRRKPTVFSR